MTSRQSFADPNVSAITAGDTGVRLDVTDASSATTADLAAGTYKAVVTVSTGIVWANLGNSAAIPSNQGIATTAVPIVTGDLIITDGTVKLSGICGTAAATGTIALRKIA